MTKITTKLILNVTQHVWATKKIFQSRSPKMASISFTFYPNLLVKNIRFVSCNRAHLQKGIVLKKYVKNNVKINYAELHIHTKRTVSGTVCRRIMSLPRKLTLLSHRASPPANENFLASLI